MPSTIVKDRCRPGKPQRQLARQGGAQWRAEKTRHTAGFVVEYRQV
jgi:hypothetical protein